MRMMTGTVEAIPIFENELGVRDSIDFSIDDADIPEDPKEWIIPHDEWRQGQVDGIAIAYGLRDQYRGTGIIPTLIYEGPTGSGKSGFAVGAGAILSHQIVITHTTDLQDQYNQVYNVPTVKGRARYPCTNQEWRRIWSHRYGKRFNSHGVEEPSVDDCRYDSPDNASSKPECAECPYLAAKYECLRFKSAVLNVHYAYYTKWWRRMGAGVLVCDEAHGLPEVLSSLADTFLTANHRETYGWPSFPEANGSSKMMYDRFRKWVPEALAATDLTMSMAEAMTEGLEFQRLKRRTDRLVEKLKWLNRQLGKANEGDYYLRSIGGELVIRSVDIRQPFTDLTSSKADYGNDPVMVDKGPSIMILMSATIGDPIALAEELGINRDVYFYSAEATFPEENRPVFFWKDAPKLSYRSTDEDWKAVVNRIDTIIDMYQGQRGLIHVSSWAQAKKIQKFTRHKGRVRLPQQGITRTDAVHQFINGNPDTVIVSPSWDEGLDFVDDQARFCILAKMKFLSLKDPIVGLKMKREGGQRWYNWKAVNSAVQAAGRIVRHPKDWGETWIVDGNWKRVAKHAPKWFVVQEVLI